MKRLALGMATALLALMAICVPVRAEEYKDGLLQKIKQDLTENDHKAVSNHFKDARTGAEGSAVAVPVLTARPAAFFDNIPLFEKSGMIKQSRSPVRINIPRLGPSQSHLFGLFEIYKPHEASGLVVELPNGGKMYFADAEGGVAIDRMSATDWTLMGMADYAPFDFFRNSNEFYKITAHGPSMDAIYALVVWREDSDNEWHYAMRAVEG